MQKQSTRLKPFVANRVSEINDHTNPRKWRYTPTKENSADYMTSCVLVDILKNEIRWREGSKFLKSDETGGPKRDLKKQEFAKNLHKN